MVIAFMMFIYWGRGKMIKDKDQKISSLEGQIRKNAKDKVEILDAAKNYHPDQWRSMPVARQKVIFGLRYKWGINKKGD